MDYIEEYLNETIYIARNIDRENIQNVVSLIRLVKNRKGRLFFIGSGGSAGTASHAVNDFRKIAGIESYSPSDNVSELTARINDEGWASSYSEWLKVSNFNKQDCLFILSVGGGDEIRNISPNIIESVKLAHEVGADIVGIVGRPGGYTEKHADQVIKVIIAEEKRITPHAEEFQSVLLHLLVSHPLLQVNKAKWESEDEK